MFAPEDSGSEFPSLEKSGASGPFHPALRSRASVASLCRTYRLAVQACVFQQWHSASEAEAVTREFLQWCPGHQRLQEFMQGNGRFRQFLIEALQDFLNDERRDPAKRAITLRPEALAAFDRIWALAVRHGALLRLEEEYRAEGKLHHFHELKVFLSNDPVSWKTSPNLRQLLAAPGAEVAVAVVADRLRKRYYELVQEEVARTVSAPGDLEPEIESLFARR